MSREQLHRGPDGDLSHLSKAELVGLGQRYGLTHLDHLRQTEILSLLRRLLKSASPKLRLDILNAIAEIDRPGGASPAVPSVTAQLQSQKQKKAAQGHSPKGATGTLERRLPPPNPLRLDQRLTLMVRDAESLFAYWDLAADLNAEPSEAPLHLALYDDARTVAYFPVPPWARSYYLPILHPGAPYRVELGRLKPDGFHPLLISNGVVAPSQGDAKTPSDERASSELITAASSSTQGRQAMASAQPPQPHGPTQVKGCNQHQSRNEPPQELHFFQPNLEHQGPPPRAAGASPLPPMPQEASVPWPPSSGTGASGELPLNIPQGSEAPHHSGARSREQPSGAPHTQYELVTLPELFGARALRNHSNPEHGPSATPRAPLQARIPYDLLLRMRRSKGGSSPSSPGSAYGIGSPSLWSGALNEGRAEQISSLQAQAPQSTPAQSTPAQSTTRPTTHDDDVTGPTAGSGSPPPQCGGMLALVLHAHLPFVRHPEHDVALEEDWLFEALTEAYLPLLALLQKLAAEAVPYRLTLAISPPLLSMLDDPMLLDRYERHLGWLQKLLMSELHRTRDLPREQALARYYLARIDRLRGVWERSGRELPRAFGDLARAGHIDLLTCAATHGLLPLMDRPEPIAAQITVATQTHLRLCGLKPEGIWLPECAYQPGLEQHLAEAGLRYFVVDTHGIEDASPPPPNGRFQPVRIEGSDVHAFGRDPNSAEQVWSREQGYPGDPTYRDFYRDIGFDLPRSYLAPMIGPKGLRKATGIKYHRITGATAHKELYEPGQVPSTVAAHAAHFVAERRSQLAEQDVIGAPPPLVVAPYDAELFGHWWHEGIDWLEAVLRRCDDPAGPRLVHLGGYLNRYQGHPEVTLSHSSWGEGGYNAYWLSDENAWIYPELHRATEVMCSLATLYTEPSALERRALNQAARELLLAQSSDWAFMMRAGTSADYATTRTEQHLSAVFTLADELKNGAIDPGKLKAFEQRHGLFPDIDYGIYRVR